MREALRTGRKRYRSARYRLRERFRPTVLTAEDVATALRECGLGEGDACFIQAAMSAFGAFEDGPDTVVEGLETRGRAEGLITMPSYSLTGPAIEHLAAEPVFDAAEHALAHGRRLRGLPARARNAAERPSHAFDLRAGAGGGREIVAGHESADTPFGEGTPFPRIRDRGALQLFFGCGTGAITMYHCFECIRVPPFPLDVFADRAFDARCVDRYGNELTVRTLVHNPALHPGRIDSNPRLQGIYRDAILDAGGVAVKLGHGEIIAIRLPALFEVFERLVQRGITIYDHELPAKPPAEPPQERVRD